MGQHLFDAFPDNPETLEAKAVANVRAALETVLTTKQPHEMAPQHYDMPDRTRLGHCSGCTTLLTTAVMLPVSVSLEVLG